MAVGKKKKTRKKLTKIDEDKQIYLNLPPKTKTKRKEKNSSTLLLTHFDEKIFSRAFFFSCYRKLEIPN